jgi:ectoine hydroxylase-related dioxygenase (phytanoyl-CoA dioxygenase family)
MLSPEQVAAFFEVGFALQPHVFAAEEIGKMRAAFESLERTAYRLKDTRMHRGSQFVLSSVADGSHPTIRIDRIVWCGAAEPVLSVFGEDLRLLAMASQLLGSREMNHLINQAHFKLPGDGIDFPWHQDSTHRRYGGEEWRDLNGRGSFVQTLTAIDDVTVENGPLQVIPESCKLGHVVPPEGGVGWLPAELDPRTAVSVTMQAGSVLLFGPYTFHRSQPNCSAHPRRVFINGFAYPGANSRVYPGVGAGRLVRY